ncbi:hypothetical protein Leryth_010958 [Lithospermum erythrorhizon]|nr:hypothetical protein Leryth_010958 [Lithospermum erythrorhizon]
MGKEWCMRGILFKQPKTSILSIALGKGGYGSVYRLNPSQPVKLFAVKDFITFRRSFKFVDGSNLLNILRNHEQVQNFKWINRFNVVKGVADALSYMHHEVSPPLVHRDISSKNILLN